MNKFFDLKFNLVCMSNVKVYVNGKRSRKKIIVDNNGWRFVKPLKLTDKDHLTFTYEIKE